VQQAPPLGQQLTQRGAVAHTIRRKFNALLQVLK